MNSSNKTWATAFAPLAIASLLAGCSGGGNSTSLPKTAGVTGQAAVKAPDAILVHGSLPIGNGSTGTARGAQLIPATATTVTVYVINNASTSGQPTYYPTSTCTTLPSPGAALPGGAPYAAPPGNDYFVVVSGTGACATSTGTLPTQVLNAVTFAQTNGVYTAPTNISSLPVVGTSGSGFLTQQVLGPATVVPGGVGPATAVVLGYPLSTTQTLSGASLSTATAGLTSFEMDPGITMGLPFSISLNSPSGTAAPASSQLDAPVTITLTDTSTNAAGGATPGVLKLAQVSSTGVVRGGAAVPTSVGGCPATATATCAQIALAATPAAGDQFVILYTGQNQDTFQTGALKIAYQGNTLATLAVSNQSQVITQTGANLTTPSATVLGPFGLATGFPQSGTYSSSYVADINGATTSRIIRETPSATPFTTPALTSVVGFSDTAQYTSVTTNPVAASSVYAGDIACNACTTGQYGIYQWNNGFAAATAGTLVTVPANQSPFQSTVLPPFKAGPVGMVFIPTGSGVNVGAAGDLIVAANNSLYRFALATTTSASSVTLIAGTGIPGSVGQGTTDNASGLAAKFNFSTSNFVGMTSDETTAGVITSVYLIDSGNGTIRKVVLSGTNTVSTVGSASAATGITYDPRNKFLYLSQSNSTIASMSTAGTAAGFAGTVNVSGTNDGLGSIAYPVQFNVGNAVSTAAGGAAATAFGGLGLAANSNAAAQASAGVASYVAKFSKPQGIGYDYNTSGVFWLLDNAATAGTAPSFRVLQ